MKRMILFTHCLLLVGAMVAQAAPLVELLFNDAPADATANLGSLGGTQNLPGGAGASGGKSTGPLVPFNFEKVWNQGNDSTATTYGTYHLPAMSAMTVAFWLNSNNTTSFKNVWASNFATPPANNAELGAYIQNGTLNLLGPGGTRYITAAGTPTGTWTHIAYSYDSSSSAFQLYVNGVVTTFSGSWSGAIVAESDGLGLSISNHTGSSGLSGEVDNLFIYNSVLSQGQIQSLMTTNELPIPEPAALGLLALGLFGLVSRRARK